MKKELVDDYGDDAYGHAVTGGELQLDRGEEQEQADFLNRRVLIEEGDGEDVDQQRQEEEGDDGNGEENFGYTFKFLN